MSQLRARWDRAKTILRTEGLSALLKNIVLSVLEPVYYRNVFTLSTRNWSSDLELNLADYRPDIDGDITTKIVYSNQQADQLEEEGFSFRKYPTRWNDNLTLYTDWLDKGVIACCTFIDKELGAISWAIPFKEAQVAIKTYPLKVDYANHEVFIRGAWTNPKYRGKGLWRYSSLCRSRLLVKDGMTISKTMVDIRNMSGLRLQKEKAYKATIYGKGHETKVLWWKFWREEHFSEN